MFGHINRRAAMVVLLCAAVAGCTSTGQRFTERTWSVPGADGRQYVTDETIVKNRTIAPPFGSKATATHDMLAEIGVDGEWHLEMGSAGDVEGGDLSAALQALNASLAEVRKILQMYHPATATASFLSRRGTGL